MVDPQPDTSPRSSLERLADELVAANRDWSEAFLRFKYSKPLSGSQPVTDGQARAQADVAVDLVGARTRYEVAIEQYRQATALLQQQAINTINTIYAWPGDGHADGTD